MPQVTTNPLQYESLLSRILWLNIGLFVLSFGASAQQAKPDPKEEVFSVVEQPPQPVGGFQALDAYLAMNRHYPDSAAKAGITGKVFVQFIVEPDGQLTNASVVRGIGYGCDEEALRLIKAMPRWNPGRQSGRAIRVKYNLPIAFGVK